MGNCPGGTEKDEIENGGQNNHETSFNSQFESEKRNLLLKNDEMQKFINNSSGIKIDLGKNAAYTGDVHENKANGKGTLKTDDYVVIGDFVNGRPNGKAWIVYSDKNEYNGNFVNGLYHGKGVYKSNKGYVYEGNFELNKFNGHGICKWIDGSTYEGEFKADKFEGYGVYTYPDQKVFKGHYKNGLKEGEGELVFPNNQGSCTGIWANGNISKLNTMIVAGKNVPQELVQIPK